MSDADLLGQGIPDDNLEIWLYDTMGMTLTRVTSFTPANRGGFHPSLSSDETKLAFMGAGEGIPQGQAEIFVYDTVAMALTRITSGIRASEAPSVNADGTKIAFMSNADFLGQGIPVLQKEIWLYSLAKGQVYLPIVLKQSP